MVHFLTLAEGAGHVPHFIRHFGRKYARTLSETTYAEFLGRKEIPCGVYVFADRDRMTPPQRALAIRLWKAMEAHGSKFRLVNDPARQLGRYDLLKTLHAQGVNAFQVWRLDELPQAIPYPIFVREENDHGGPRSGLLYSADELLRALAALALEGVAREDMLVCQYQETVGSDGVFRKYGALRIGSQVFGQFVILERRWEKNYGERIRTPEAREENQAYFRDNPHESLLRPIFEQAHVEYGRMDYAFSDGRLQVWEINDNPFLAAPILSHYIAETGVSRYLEGLSHLEREAPSDGTVRLEFPWTTYPREERAAY